MRNKSSYIIIYTVILCVVSAVILGSVKQVLSQKQDDNIALDNKKKILQTIMTVDETTDINTIYAARVTEFVIDSKGQTFEGVKLKDVRVSKERKLPVDERKLPLYMIKSIKDSAKIEFYVFPTSGSGLWDAISSYIAIKGDGKTIKGVAFDHVGETPGLGARIKSDPLIAPRYADKELYSDDFEPTAVYMVKGEGYSFPNDPHKVDGMSGATLTANGVNAMLKEYAVAYQNFFKSLNK